MASRTYQTAKVMRRLSYHNARHYVYIYISPAVQRHVVVACRDEDVAFTFLERIRSINTNYSRVTINIGILPLYLDIGNARDIFGKDQSS